MFQPSSRVTCMQGISGFISFKLNVMGSTMDKSGGTACVAVVYVHTFQTLLHTYGSSFWPSSCASITYRNLNIFFGRSHPSGSVNNLYACASLSCLTFKIFCWCWVYADGVNKRHFYHLGGLASIFRFYGQGRARGHILQRSLLKARFIVQYRSSRVSQTQALWLRLPLV